MERLCDEVLQLIFYELTDPSPLTLVSQRFYRFSKDPYVRAHYFLIHYGPIEAMYYVLGRGKILTERVLDILLSSGAHLSRYLVQIAIHHYFHTQAHFIKSEWVRTVPFKVFIYFLKIAEDRYGEIPRGRGEDDGTVFTVFLKESRVSSKTVSWETIKGILGTYKFIPFCHRDPIMPQFPLALAIEPRLLPYAVANGFSMDYKYRDFVFRKMFERPSTSSQTRAEDVANNVRELCELDPAMFVSRTIAAEVCMEAKANDIGYTALKQLDKSGDLRFELSTLVEELLRTFLTTRSINSISTGDVLLHLFADYPSPDVVVRLVVLIVVFISADNINMNTAAIRTKLETLGLMPITRRDVYNILVNPFVERFSSLLDFAKEEIGVKEDGSKGMSNVDIEKLVEKVTTRCLEISCKGKLVKKLYEAFPTVKNVISAVILSKHQIELEDLPSWDIAQNAAACQEYSGELSRDFLDSGPGEVYSLESLAPEQQKTEPMDVDAEVPPAQPEPVVPANAPTEAPRNPVGGTASDDDLGEITQETLTAMIRHDESVPARSRRRHIYNFHPLDLSGKMRYPHDALHVAKWAKQQFGYKSPVVAVFMKHAVLNNNSLVLHNYLATSDHNLAVAGMYVPVTLKHFQLLARVGRSPNWYLWRGIEDGAEFFASESDYLSEAALAKSRSVRGMIVKSERPKSELPRTRSPSPGPSSNGGRGKKRPRRTAVVAVRSYAVPDSDDEEILGEDSMFVDPNSTKKVKKETDLQLWIKHLNLLLKAETKTYKEMRKRMDIEANGEYYLRPQKNEFMKSLKSNLRSLRKVEAEKRTKNPNEDVVDEYSDEEDDDFTLRRVKKRKSVPY